MFWKKNKRAIYFLGWFLGVYVLGNVFYGLYIQHQYPRPDVFTEIVAKHTSMLLNSIGFDTTIAVNRQAPTYSLKQKGITIVEIYEGCNAINVMIVFAAFVLALGGPAKKMSWFLPLGITIIYAVNLFRVSLLFWVAQHYQIYFYYVHKYFFTALIYMVVLALWAVWIKMVTEQPRTVHE